MDKLKVPSDKMIRSFAISSMALIAAFVLDWLTIVDASPLTVALLAPLVNYVRELKKTDATGEPSPPADQGGA